MSSRKAPAARGKRKTATSAQNGHVSEEVPAKKKKAAAAPMMPRKPRGMIKLSEGEIITDLVKKQWRVGDLMSWGGFGAIHHASDNTSSKVGQDSTYIVKIEPHSNGPLFVELSFYMRVAKPELISSWIKSHSLKYLGIPPYIASGSMEKDGKKFRFMIMDRFGEDVGILFKKNNKFAMSTVLQLGLRIVDCLWYIHSQGFVHADIKGSNLMLGYEKSKQSQVYLVDFGLAYKFDRDGTHKEYKEDPRKRHDGTVEFTSRDAHKGVDPSRRGDMEILGYCLVQWACGELPWEDNLADKEYVQEQKTRHMKNIPKFVKDCMNGTSADELVEFLKLVDKLEYDEAPNYKKIKEIFSDGLKKRGVKDDGKTVDFHQSSDALPSMPLVVEDSPSPVKKQRRTSKVKEAEVPKAKPKKSPVKRAAASSKAKTSPRRKQPSRQRGRPPVMVDFAQSP